MDRKRLALACALILPAGSAARAGEPQAEILTFGTLHVGATAEGNVRFYFRARDFDRSLVKVTPPPNVRVLSVDFGLPPTENVERDARWYCDLVVSIETGRETELTRPIVVAIGRDDYDVPVNGRIIARREGSPRVLVIDTPFHKYSSSNSRPFDAWLGVVDRFGLDVEYRDLRSKAGPVVGGVELSKYDTILLADLALARLTDADVGALRVFVKSGGRVVLAANYFMRGSVDQANKLLIPSGLDMADAETRDDDGDREGLAITPCPLTEGVKTLSFKRASRVKLHDQARGMILVAAKGKPEEAFVAVGRDGEGEVVALGQSLWWHWANDADNATLLGNLLKPRARRR